MAVEAEAIAEATQGARPRPRATVVNAMLAIPRHLALLSVKTKTILDFILRWLIKKIY